MTTPLQRGRRAPTSNAELARRALEDVCARGDLEAAKELYAADFVDHVNGRTFHGQAGIRQSVTVYVKLFENLRIHVDEQAADGERVASRWTLSGNRRGRRVNLSGMTISRFSDGKIVEDRTVSDTVGLLRQLGVRRSLGVAFDWYRGAK